MSKKVLIITLLFLSIGFASINTTMFVEGLSKVVFNSDEFKVYFSAVYLDDEDYSNEILNEGKDVITYTAAELKNAGSSIGLSYDITNASTLYDAVITVNCTSSMSQVIVNTGGTQTTGGTLAIYPDTVTRGGYGTLGGFGKGGNGNLGEHFGEIGSGSWGSAGGGGYYGGAGGGWTDCSVESGAGGSSFVSGHNGCDAIKETSTETNIIHTGQSVHYSGYVFTNTKMIDGAGYQWTTTKGSSVVGMPTHDGNSIMTGNSGNGYAKITLVALR